MNPDASYGLIQNILYPEKGVGDTDWAYERFRTISKRTYKNMFKSNDMCVHIAVNEPEQQHWNFVLVLVKQKQSLFMIRCIARIGSRQLEIQYSKSVVSKTSKTVELVI